TLFVTRVLFLVLMTLFANSEFLRSSFSVGRLLRAKCLTGNEVSAILKILRILSLKMLTQWRLWRSRNSEIRYYPVCSLNIPSQDFFPITSPVFPITIKDGRRTRKFQRGQF